MIDHITAHDAAKLLMVTPRRVGQLASDHDDYSLIIYKKGAWVLNMLRGLMRDQHTTATTTPHLASSVGQARDLPLRAGMTLGQAMRTRVFWTLNFMVLGCCTCHSCILLHGVNHMTDIGLTTPTAARVVATMAIFGMLGKIANGLLADKIGAKWAIAGFLGLQAVMVPFFLEARHAWSFYSWAILFGIGYGGPMPVYAMLFHEYFGTRAIGAILGTFFMIAVCWAACCTTCLAAMRRRFSPARAQALWPLCWRSRCPRLSASLRSRRTSPGRQASQPTGL